MAHFYASPHVARNIINMVYKISELVMILSHSIMESQISIKLMVVFNLLIYEQILKYRLVYRVILSVQCDKGFGSCFYSTSIKIPWTWYLVSVSPSHSTLAAPTLLHHLFPKSIPPAHKFQIFNYKPP